MTCDETIRLDSCEDIKWDGADLLVRHPDGKCYRLTNARIVGFSLAAPESWVVPPPPLTMENGAITVAQRTES